LRTDLVNAFAVLLLETISGILVVLMLVDRVDALEVRILLELFLLRLLGVCRRKLVLLSGN